jgi:histidinol-phosphate phosphatase family protein|tara:strand:- start:877 stop:1440 length:564 start_codon:yes stop_codon:yes gene_type:complete
VKVLLMDRDGTINRSPGPGRYLDCWEAFEFREDTVEAMQELSLDGYSFIVITNQAGVARGIVEADEVERIHRNMVDALAVLGISVLEVYTCIDHPDVHSARRKPAPGMFLEAAREYGLRLDRVLYVGDDIRDCSAAVAAGCGMVLLAEGLPPDDLPSNPQYCSVRKSLVAALEDIREFYSRGLELIS